MERNRFLVDQPGPEIRDIPLTAIGQRYERLRIVNPRADSAVYRSMANYGQFLPVVATEDNDGALELLNGFKRLRAAKALGFATLRVRVMRLSSRAGKAMLLQLNWQVRSISAIEESLTVHSLYREDGLSQVEIATLLGRHKSWVCRRIALIERICDEALERIRLGLIPVSICRELVRLPRDNQEQVLDVVCRHRLTCREGKRLVDALITRPKRDHQAILADPRRLDAGKKAVTDGYSKLVMGLVRSFQKLESHCRIVTATLTRLEIKTLTSQDRRFLAECTGPLLSSLDQAATRLRSVVEVQP